jgi:hypothetical protein
MAVAGTPGGPGAPGPGATAGPPGRPRSRTGVGSKAVGRVGVVILAVVAIVGTALALFSLWRFWPAAPDAKGASPATAVFSYFGWRVSLSRDQQFLVLAAVAGSLGGLLHALRSLSTYVGERYLFRSWLLYYVLLPLVGAVLATIVYVVLRAGLLPGETATSQPNPYGIAAVAALVGLFSGQAAEKLQAIFETIFASPQQGNEAVADITEPLVTGLVPDHGRPGESVQINGDNLSAVTHVSFNSNDQAEFTVSSPQRGMAAVPASATTGPVTLHTAESDVISTAKFTVDPDPAPPASPADSSTTPDPGASADPGDPAHPDPAGPGGLVG